MDPLGRPLLTKPHSNSAPPLAPTAAACRFGWRILSAPRCPSALASQFHKQVAAARACPPLASDTCKLPPNAATHRHARSRPSCPFTPTARLSAFTIRAIAYCFCYIFMIRSCLSCPPGQGKRAPRLRTVRHRTAGSEINSVSHVACRELDRMRSAPHLTTPLVPASAVAAVRHQQLRGCWYHGVIVGRVELAPVVLQCPLPAATPS